jgi:hypothetical protein
MEWKRLWTRRGHEIPKTTIPTTDFGSSNKTENFVIFQPFGLLGTIFTHEIQSLISVAEAGFNKKKALFACKFDLKFKE